MAVGAYSTTGPLKEIFSPGKKIGFAVAESPKQVRDILFTGNTITDGSGFVVGFACTWKGERVIVVRTKKNAERTESPRKGAALPVPPPTSSLTVEGYWAASLANQIQ